MIYIEMNWTYLIWSQLLSFDQLIVRKKYWKTQETVLRKGNDSCNCIVLFILQFQMITWTWTKTMLLLSSCAFLFFWRSTAYEFFLNRLCYFVHNLSAAFAIRKQARIVWCSPGDFEHSVFNLKWEKKKFTYILIEIRYFFDLFPKIVDHLYVHVPKFGRTLSRNVLCCYKTNPAQIFFWCQLIL